MIIEIPEKTLYANIIRQLSSFFDLSEEESNSINSILPRVLNRCDICFSANSMIIGNCKIGENCIIGAGACIKDENIPPNSLVFGQSPNLFIKSRK